jgi:predicted nucleic acid-binding protein
MSDSCFVDTNILVYARDSGAGAKQKKADALLEELWSSRRGRLSVQVLNEYFVAVTRKLKPGLPAEVAWDDVTALRAWQPVPMDWALMEQAHDLFEQHSLSWWDSLIVAAAAAAGSDVLYSEDLSHGQLLGNVRIVNPFLELECKSTTSL